MSKPVNAARTIARNKWFKRGYITLTLSLAALEADAVFNKTPGDTISEDARAAFHTDTRAGRSVWVILWSLFSGLFMAHIMGSGETFWGNVKGKK